MILFRKKQKHFHVSLKWICVPIMGLLFSFSLPAQVPITGKVTDSLDMPLAYVNVILEKDTDGEIIDGTITDENGAFKLESNGEKKYVLEVSYLGYETEKYHLNTQENTENIVIVLKESNEQLDAVLIKSTRPVLQQKTDRFVYNIDQTASGSVGTAADALKSTPGLRVKEDKIEIAGKGEVRVMINDKMIRLSGEELQTYLNSIPSDNIKSIEVISAPPAKYEAEGDSGLINIILKKAGQNSWSNTVRTNYRQGFYPSAGIGDAFLYHKDKLEISASLDASKGHIRRVNDLTFYFDDETWREPLHMKDKTDQISGNLNVDYTLTDKAVVGLTYNGSFRKNDVRDHVETQIFDLAGEEIGGIHSNGVMNNPIRSHTMGAYYDQKLDTLGRKLSLSLDYFGYDNRQNRHSETLSSIDEQEDAKIRNVNNQDISNYSVSLDMEHPTDWVNLSYGGKLLFTQNKNRLLEEIEMNSQIDFQEDYFKYRENVQAAYLDATKKFGDKWTVKAGLRFENTQTEGISFKEEDFKRSYAKWFPSAFLNYEANDDHTLNLSYSRRIRRPGFWALNPARWYINAVSYTEGNPFLQPTFTDNVELKHIYKNELISKFYIVREAEGSNQIPTIDPETKQQVYTVDNFYNQMTYGIQEVFEYSPVNWWKTTSQATLSYTDGDYKKDFEGFGKFKTSFNFMFYTDHNFFLNADKTLQLEATYTYSSPQKIVMYDFGAQSSFDIGFKALFLNKKLQAVLSLKDIFKGMKADLTTYSNGIKQDYHNYFDSRNVSVSVIYKFGNENLRSEKREAKNKTIQDRTN